MGRHRALAGTPIETWFGRLSAASGRTSDPAGLGPEPRPRLNRIDAVELVGDGLLAMGAPRDLRRPLAVVCAATGYHLPAFR